jgi:hypothetical protein
MGTTAKKAKPAKKPKSATSEIKFDGQVSLFVVLMLAIGCGLIITCGLTITEPALPAYIKPLLGIVMIFAAALMFQALKQTRPTKLVLGPSALEVTGPDGKQKYPWGKIESVRVVGAVGCFGDDPFTPIEKRIGLGLFIKNGPEGRLEASEADAILAVGKQDEGARFVDAASTIMKAVRGRQRPGGRGPASAATGPRRAARSEFAQRNVA